MDQTRESGRAGGSMLEASQTQEDKDGQEAQELYESKEFDKRD